MRDYRYTFDERGRRVLSGLSFEETQEFELLTAALPLDRTSPGIADGPLPEDLRWWDLFSKYEASLRRPQRYKVR